MTETQISWAKASFDSPSGMIHSQWKRDNGYIEFNVTVPPNCTSTIYFPDVEGRNVKEPTGYAKQIEKKEGYTLFEVPAGKYQFSN